MNKNNCWQFMQCGKELGGLKAADGVCPVAAKASEDDQGNGGLGGRLCWILAETLQYTVRCSEHHHPSSCFSCEFRYKVMTEEGLVKVCENTGSLLRTLQRPSL